MPASDDSSPASALAELGLTGTVAAIKAEIGALYRSDQVPWVVGYSGGKDSTAVLQLIWAACGDLAPAERTKPIHVISTDTLVENPVVAAWVSRSLEAMRSAALDQGLPFQVHRLTPQVTDSFWVNLIGRGYPAPRLKFRWCTERLKIRPSNEFIRSVVRNNGEAVLALGTRKAESVARARTMARHEQKAIRERLTPNAALPNCWVYTPIEDWSNDDVWAFLMRVANPWGYNNKDLLGMYRGASADGECPLVVDTATPSCGNSRFGCWVCTLVDQDKSMAAMIQNDEEKEWMLPLLRLRNELDFRSEADRLRERQRRDFRRRTGRLHYYVDASQTAQLVPGPYKQETRAYWLRRVLETQRQLQQALPTNMGELALVSTAELHEIRCIWVVENHEVEDLVPRIYEEATQQPYSGPALDDHLVYDRETLELLRRQCGGNELHYELLRNLLDIERSYRSMASRRGLYAALTEQIERCYFDDEADALDHAKRQEALREAGYAEDEAQGPIVVKEAVAEYEVDAQLSLGLS